MKKTTMNSMAGMYFVFLDDDGIVQRRGIVAGHLPDGHLILQSIDFLLENPISVM